MHYGVGINDGKYSFKSTEVIMWRAMIRRCYSEENLYKPRFKMYEGVTVEESWFLSSNFCKWVREQKGFGLKGYQLDKDLLDKESRIYSQATCCVIPKEINIALTFRDNARGKYLLGVVSRDYKGYYVAHLS